MAEAENLKALINSPELDNFLRAVHIEAVHQVERWSTAHDRAAQARPWESVKVFDTMVQWAGVGNRISLDKLCNALGLPRKGGITGSDVWPMVQAGRIKDVADYCIQDVIKTRMAHQRMTFRIVMQPEFEDVAA